jgi:hypothetical protein
MAVDFSLAASIGEKTILVIIGGAITWLFERRSRLTAFFAHVGEFRVTAPGQPPMTVHTHTIVIRNAGRLAAHNVRVPHQRSLAQANIHISVQRGVNHTICTAPGGEEEILFPVLGPKQQVTVGYLYFPPVLFAHVNLPISSDEGQAKELRVLPTPQWPRRSSRSRRLRRKKRASLSVLGQPAHSPVEASSTVG